MIYLFVASADEDVFELCLSGADNEGGDEWDDCPVLATGKDFIAINAKGQRIANELRLGGAEVDWSPWQG